MRKWSQWFLACIGLVFVAACSGGSGGSSSSVSGLSTPGQVPVATPSN